MVRRNKKSALLTLYWLAVRIYLFQKTHTDEEVIDETLEEDEEENKFNRIRCPICSWQPDSYSRWVCRKSDYPEHFADGCGTAWNTFDTRGRCPGCAHQWIWTFCLRCRRWSLHEDWYSTESG